jgi:hypothetical protein
VPDKKEEVTLPKVREKMSLERYHHPCLFAPFVGILDEEI